MREMLESGGIEAVVWVSSQEQLADVFTKEGVNKGIIREFVKGTVSRG